MYERMLNKQVIPTKEELELYCGKTSKLFQSLNSFLSTTYKTTQEIRFPYGKEYGWGITHRKGKKLICDIFVEVEAFTIMLRLSNQQFEEVYNLVQVDTQKIIDNKYPCSNGGWIHYRVVSKEDIKDIEIVLSTKCK